MICDINQINNNTVCFNYIGMFDEEITLQDELIGDGKGITKLFVNISLHQFPFLGHNSNLLKTLIL